MFPCGAGFCRVRLRAECEYCSGKKRDAVRRELKFEVNKDCGSDVRDRKATKGIVVAIDTKLIDQLLGA